MPKVVRMLSSWWRIWQISTSRQRRGTTSNEEKLRIKTDSFVFVFSGAGVKKVFGNEAGTHTWQRVPPTEKKGRMQTSSITVAVLNKEEFEEIIIHPSEVEIITTRDSGPGGQHRNVTDSCVIMTHKATGIKIKQAKKSQHQNKREALRLLTKKVNNFYKTGRIEELAEERYEQIGDGGRGGKRRSYRVKDGKVVDHVSGKTAKLKDILRGKIELLK